MPLWYLSFPIYFHHVHPNRDQNLPFARQAFPDRIGGSLLGAGTSSPSAVTWPPTNFSVTLACTVTDPSGVTVLTEDVTGTGTDHPYTGLRVIIRDATTTCAVSILN